MGRCERLTVTPRSTPLNLLIVVCDARIITRRWVFLTLMHVAWQANGSGVERYGQRVFGRCSFQKAGKKTSMTGRGRQKLGTPRPPDAQLKTVRGGQTHGLAKSSRETITQETGPGHVRLFATLPISVLTLSFFTSFLSYYLPTRPGRFRALLFTLPTEREKKKMLRETNMREGVSRRRSRSGPGSANSRQPWLSVDQLVSQLGVYAESVRDKDPLQSQVVLKR